MKVIGTLRWVKRESHDPDCVTHPGWPENGDTYLVLQQIVLNEDGKPQWADVTVEEE